MSKHRAPGPAVTFPWTTSGKMLAVAGLVPLLTTGSMQAVPDLGHEEQAATRTVALDLPSLREQSAADDADATYIGGGEARDTAAEVAAEAARVAAEKAAQEAAEKAAAEAAAAAAEASTPRHRVESVQVASVASGDAAAVIEKAKTFLGTPYVYGGTGYSGIDCSALMQAAFAAAGVHLPRVSSAQAQFGTQVSEAEAQPGDLISFGSPVTHVALYLGDGKMLAAPRPGKDVQIQPVYSAHTRYFRIL